MKGIVFDIQRFSTHDGPGIRSTVFTKGCHLDCPWCQNPEGRIKQRNLWYFANKCIHCESCVKACPRGAVSSDGDAGIVIDRERCMQCQTCVTACPANALAYDSQIMTAEQVVQEVLKDKAFYDMSGGGVTLSGGDPLYQYRFALEILKGCKEHRIDTAIETCLYAKREVLVSFVDVVDYFITDVKIFDPLVHRKTVGVSNEQIKSNFEFLAARVPQLLVRIPLIPGFTDGEDNIRAIARYVHRVRKDVPIELINFNPLAESKYTRMNKPYRFEHGTKPFAPGKMQIFREMILDEGVTVIG